MSSRSLVASNNNGKAKKNNKKTISVIRELVSRESPFELLSLAVQFDEKRGKRYLLVDLETSSVHHNDEFVEALQALKGNHKRLDFAVTPVILSGLLKVIVEDEDSGENNNLSLELVMQTNRLRRAALRRLRIRARHRQIQNTVLPGMCIVVLLVSFLRTMQIHKRSLREFLGHSCDHSPAYFDACRVSEAAIWWKYRDALLFDSSKDQPAPVLQTTLHRYRLDGGNTDSQPGKSVISDLIQSAIVNYTKNPHIIDVGCGVGGMAHDLLELFESYDGVAISEVEVRMARNLARHSQKSVTFHHQSFDHKLPRNNYTVALAVDSLSYSRNLPQTITNIVDTLVPSGIFIVIDDVLYPSCTSESELRPSLVPHTTWITSFERANCELTHARDLSSEYELLILDELKVYSRRDASIWGLLPLSSSIPLERVLSRFYESSRRFMDMHKERKQLVDVLEERLTAYSEEACLYYHMYVCVKE